MSTVAKLSNKFQKFLQFQAVDGKAYLPESPFDIADAECAEELQLGLQCDNMYRDMSTWRVTIPSVSTKQDQNTKPYPVFTIHVIDIGCKDQGEDSVKVKWNVERRYNDFYILQGKLTEFHGDFGEGFQLPSKTGIFSPRGNEFLESRRQLFEEYLQKLLQLPNLRGSDLLFSFLNSSAEFTSCLAAPDGIGKMIRKSVEPIKLRKERGQHLDNFLNTFLMSIDSSKKGSKYEWQDVSYERPRNKRCITNSIFRNNFDEFLRETDQSADVQSETVTLSGSWDCIFFTASTLMGASFRVLQMIATVKFLLGQSSDMIFKKYINQKLRTVLVPARVSHLVRLLQGALFNSTYHPGRRSESLRDRIVQQLRQMTQSMVLKFFLPQCSDGLEKVVDVLQHPILNKHLCYCLLDEIVRVLFPEMATSS
ncbi:UNVERIFIED_CONTAM: hypothetical protein PYX00_001035 [Menopon gallinae]|uniref:PX domain-containing protein n=1 Tax=Menopon gallinae TaxID=328185 RepID=A0AAW2IAT2_9NEOP